MVPSSIFPSPVYWTGPSIIELEGLGFHEIAGLVVPSVETVARRAHHDRGVVTLFVERVVRRLIDERYPALEAGVADGHGPDVS
jgi:hypothetical protein